MKDRNNIRSIIYISLFWSFLISSITAVFTFSQNPDIMLFQARFYLFLFCFFSNLLIFAGISTAVFILFKLFKYKKTDRYPFFYSYFIILFNISVLITDHIRLSLENKLSLYSYIYNPVFLFISFLSILFISIVLYFALKWLSRPVPALYRLIALIICAVLLLFSLSKNAVFSIDTTEITAKQDYEISESGIKVIFLGIDSINPDVIDPLFRQGKLPNLKFLHENGSSFLLETLEPGKSPIIWNSIYTSTEPSEHGIKGFRMFKMPFFKAFDDDVQFPPLTIQRYIARIIDRLNIIESRPYHSIHRKRKAIWDILQEKGKTSSVISGWTLYPAYEIMGNMISAEYSYPDKRKRIKSISLYPPELDASLNEFIIKPQDISFKDLSYYINATEAEYQKLLQDSWTARNIFILKKAIAMDRTFFNIALSIWQKDNYDFRELYIRQTDTLSHAFWNHYHSEEYPDNEPDRVSIFKDTIPSSYEKADEYIGYIIENFLDENTVLMVASDHGMLSTGRLKKPGDHIYGKPEGLLYIYNPGIIKADDTLRKASIYDIAPTILYLYGFPHAGDFKGRILIEAFKPEFLEKFPLKTISSYGSIDIELPASYDEQDDKTLNHIKALGYI